MIPIPFVFAGTEEEFRALDPAPVQYWGHWTASMFGDVLVGVILATNVNVRAHTHPKIKFLPSHGTSLLAEHHTAALKRTGIDVEPGHTLSAAIAKLRSTNAAEFLHPDRF